jgi:4-hydroxy-tetrahydrodipicolinate reductase
MAPMRIAIAGASGRMGRMLIEATIRDDRLRNWLQRWIVPMRRPSERTPARFSAAGLRGSDQQRCRCRACRCADFLIDFTRPEATLAHLDVCLRHGVKMIIGTTGFSDVQRERLARCVALDLAIVLAPNMAVGVNAVFRLLDLAARILEQRLRRRGDRGASPDEGRCALRHCAAHGRGRCRGAGLGRSLKDCAIYGREGHTGERADSTIGFSTIRGGDIVGDHTVLFAGIGERVEITHKAASRMPYALGSLRAARWLVERVKAGLYDMQDVLGLR